MVGVNGLGSAPDKSTVALPIEFAMAIGANVSVVTAVEDIAERLKDQVPRLVLHGEDGPEVLTDQDPAVPDETK
jgi:hypothetical protein